jgi:hypothetical protein
MLVSVHSSGTAVAAKQQVKRARRGGRRALQRARKANGAGQDVRAAKLAAMAGVEPSEMRDLLRDAGIKR